MGWLLEKYGGNRREAAEKLGISERTFYRMLERYRIGQE
jgi:DNA-binding NtrC family response regulator